jgi:transcriptional regulator with XRE-family HTH domain
VQRVRRKKSSLRLIRESNGLSRQQLAEDLGIAYNTLKRWELGYAPPNAANLLRLAARLGVTAEKLASVAVADNRRSSSRVKA